MTESNLSDKKILFAVVGAGFIGKRHMAMIAADAQTELAAVCDVRSAGQCGIEAAVPFYPTIAAMLAAHPEVDVVSICTPNGLHAQMAAEVLRAGKNVLLEKPMALTVEDAMAIGRAEKESAGRVFSVFQNRYTPTSKWAKEIISSGRLGSIRQVLVNCMWNRDERYYTAGHWHGTADMDGGTLFTQFSHFVDLLLWLAGPIDVGYAMFKDICHSHLTDFEDTGVFTFRLQGEPDAVGVFNYTTAVANQNFEVSLTIIGSKGSIRLGGPYMNDVTLCDIPGYDMPQLPPSAPANDYGGYKGSAVNHSHVIRNVAEALIDGAPSVAGWQEGFDVVKTICDVYAHRPATFACTHRLAYEP